MTALLPLPVVLPLFGAGLALAMGRSARAQRVVSLVVLGTTTLITAVLVAQVHTEGPLAMRVGGWPADIGISLVADRLSVLMLLVSTVVSLCVLVYSLGQGMIEYGSNTPLSVYHPTYLVLVAGVSNAFLSGDLFNLYVGFEILLVASYVLLTLGGTGARIRAGTVYVTVSLISSVIFLAAIALVYAATGTVNMAQLGGRLAELPDAVALVLQLMLLIGFAIKAAVFPLSAWLPDSYPTAPAPVTAVFAGLLTKVGIYAIIRLQTLLFPDSPLSGLLMWTALFTMIIGVLGAVAQSDIKRVLSFTLVSHIGYMVFGIALGSEAGMSSAIFYVAHHITIQTTLFLVAGLIDRLGGSTSLDHLGRLAQRAPLLAVLFFIPAMNLAGIPPFSGFLGKLGLLQAGVDDGSWLAYVLVAGGVVASLLTLYAMAKVWNRAFWQPPNAVGEPPEDPVDPVVSEPVPVAARTGAPTGATASSALEGGRPESAPGSVRTRTDLHDKPMPDTFSLTRRSRLAMTLPAAVLVVLSTALTVVAGPLFHFTDEAARDLREPSSYVETVLGEGNHE
ncbi:Na+/H+ antiporter subunit D [Streptomyces megasporus]|uniref:Na+/H+ antiporter subunit D n=1 Tax=Streptomyces megasporus TaxID=44060 RepID=UPI000561EAAA|nr:Na+/H+ antiporter subunit D [Streptomyces megasporus]